MSSIITFYSYKGGVGRSMALANIAYELSKKGKKVLIIDWDLEAPGLEKYFSSFYIENSGAGLLPIFLDIEAGKLPDYKEYLWTINLDSQFKISFLHSGREKAPDSYSAKLEKFNWEVFFKEKKGGEFLERLREQWKKDFDIVLIDSRTGLSDSSGICTILLPDIIVPLFTANYQSLYGVRDIMRYIKSARQKLENDRTALTILPIPTRFGTRVEFKESQEWLDRFSEALKEFFSDWLPKWISPKYILEQVKIPQVDYFSFGEKLAVAEHGTSDPESMGFIYARIASLLASDFTDLVPFIGQQYYTEKKLEYEKNKEVEDAGKQTRTDTFVYDIFISRSHDNLTTQWINEIAEVLIEYLSEELGYKPRIFNDYNEISSGEIWANNILEALRNSKILVPFILPDYLKSKFSQAEIRIFTDREEQMNVKMIFPVIIKKFSTTDVNIDYLLDRKGLDVSDINIDELRKSIKLKIKFAQEIEAFAKAIATSIHDFSLHILLNSSNEFIQNNPGYIDAEVRMLAKEYEELRKVLPSSDSRTRYMESIITKMKTISQRIAPSLPQLAKSDSAGERLAAIAALHDKPSAEYLHWLSQHVGEAEKPFIGFQASLGLYLAAKNLDVQHKDEVQKAINAAVENINKAKFKDPNQLKVLSAAKTEMGYK